MRLLDFTLCVLMFQFFFGESLVTYGLFPGLVNSYAPELLIYALLCDTFLKRKMAGASLCFPGLVYVVILVACTVLSSLALEVMWLNGALMLRLLLRFYAMFLAIVNLDISDDDIRWYLKGLAILFVIQIPTAAFKMMIYGQGESAIGTYATHGGGNSVSIPMIATGFLLSYYLSYRRSGSCLLGIAGFVAFGIIGGKKAIFVMVPLAAFFAMWNARKLFIDGRRIPVHFFCITFIAALAVGYLAVRCVPKLNPDGVVWGTFDLEYLMDYSVDYSISEHSGIATSRGATFLRSLEHANTDTFTMAFGLGPGCVMKSRFAGIGRGESEGIHGTKFGGTIAGLDIMYGLNGFSWMLLQVGYLGSTAWLAFYCRMLLALNRMARSEPEPFWRAYYLGMGCFTFTVLWISLSYGSYMIAGDLMPFLYFLMLGFGFVRRIRPDNLGEQLLV